MLSTLYKGIDIEDYLKEQEEMAYDMFQREALYEYIEKKHESRDDITTKKEEIIDTYVRDLLKYANIKFHDIEIENACK